jgi:hypothetical protein
VALAVEWSANVKLAANGNPPAGQRRGTVTAAAPRAPGPRIVREKDWNEAFGSSISVGIGGIEIASFDPYGALSGPSTPILMLL